MARRTHEPPELRALRRRIDALDRRIVSLINERTELTRSIGAVKSRRGRAIRDAEREREVLLRVTMANTGPIAQADLLAIYRRLIAATRALQQADLDLDREPGASGPSEGDGGADSTDRPEPDGSGRGADGHRAPGDEA